MFLDVVKFNLVEPPILLNCTWCPTAIPDTLARVIVAVVSLFFTTPVTLVAVCVWFLIMSPNPNVLRHR